VEPHRGRTWMPWPGVELGTREGGIRGNRTVEPHRGIALGVESLLPDRDILFKLVVMNKRPRRLGPTWAARKGHLVRLPTMLHATNADGKPDSNDSPLSLAEIRRILHEAANPCYWITGLTLWKGFHADRDVLPDHAEVYRRAATEHCAKFYIARHDLLGHVSPATWAALPLDGESWQAIDPRAAARACAAALAELVCAEAASHSAPTPAPTAPPTPAPSSTPTADPGPATPPSDPPAPRRKGRGANIDARMFKVLSERPESLDWSCRQWAEHLGCACSTVAGTTTWKIRIPQVRSLHQAERIRRGSRR
jgi:hypothetical protein